MQTRRIFFYANALAGPGFHEQFPAPGRHRLRLWHRDDGPLDTGNSGFLWNLAPFFKAALNLGFAFVAVLPLAFLGYIAAVLLAGASCGFKMGHTVKQLLQGAESHGGGTGNINMDVRGIFFKATLVRHTAVNEGFQPLQFVLDGLAVKSV